jgi:hypothetical protein
MGISSQRNALECVRHYDYFGAVSPQQIIATARYRYM